MSHSVTITRTTVASSGTTTAVFINSGYLSTLPGLLKVAQLLLGAACVGVVGYYVDHFSSSYGFVTIHKSELFYLLTAVTFMIGTFCLLASCLASLSSSSMISRSTYEVVYHGLAMILYLCAAIVLLIEVNNRNSFHGEKKNAYTAAAIMGLVMAGLYLLSAFFANRHYRGF